jgi:hypothetical protein
MSLPIDPELPLREHAWLRRLAYSLAADPGTSADGLRAWLASVARNLARGRGRRGAKVKAHRGAGVVGVAQHLEGRDGRAALQRWRDDQVLVWTASLREPPASEGGGLTIPLVPAGRVERRRRPEDVRNGSPHESWPVVLALGLASGAHVTVELP